ncbi:MAG: DUF2905 domain-containing protein [Lentisphaerae bacterium]|nr:DUF2905 domain-containing protein [Lentisphaerota bacterium]
MKDVGILLVIAGSAVVLTGALILLATRLPWLGNLPGDIHLRGKSWSFSFPLVTCIVLTVLLNIVVRLFRR